ncbi:KTSC domain-containing protein [Pedobacter chinensis]|uniref:KTSC domain-containing protein n=1 Tax=Pedobacter chinensis TaxID=2282421 RepID=A0A369Q157_9SPHI|nr:KTSC domain-containing protein [Pedobacter chinensis]RDC58613.1 KTSC domain-containing protein [Pedobacter chinensis]
MPSSVINHFSYDADAKSLQITFVTGMVYQYKGVPQKVFNMLKAAGSKGRYFNHYIKDKYKFQKVEE